MEHQRGLERVHRVMEIGRRTFARGRLGGEIHARERAGQRGFVLGEMATAGRRDLEQALGALGGRGFHVAQFFEQRERGIHGAGAGRIAAAELLLQLLDELVAVTRFLVDEAEQHQAQIAGAEHPAATATATAERAAEEPAATEAETALAGGVIAPGTASAPAHRMPLRVRRGVTEESLAKHWMTPDVPYRYGINDISLVLFFQEHLP